MRVGLEYRRQVGRWSLVVTTDGPDVMSMEAGEDRRMSTAVRGTASAYMKSEARDKLDIPKELRMPREVS